MGRIDAISARALYRRPAAAFFAALLILLGTALPAVEAHSLVLRSATTGAGESAASSIDHRFHQVPAEPAVTKSGRSIAPLEAAGSESKCGLSATGAYLSRAGIFPVVMRGLSHAPRGFAVPLFCLHCVYLI